MVEYQKLYAMLVGEIDRAVSQLEAEGSKSPAKEILLCALESAEEEHMKDGE